MTTPTAVRSPAVPTAAIPGLDEALTGRLTGTARVLAGVLAAGALDTAGRPEKLPELLFPHLAEEDVRAVWDAAVVVGWRAGVRAGRSRWDPHDLDAAREALEGAGWAAMGRLVRAPLGAARCAAAVPGESTPVEESW